VEAGAHVQRHEEPAGGDPGSARVLLPGADGRLAGAAAGGHHDEHPCEIISWDPCGAGFYASNVLQRKKIAYYFSLAPCEGHISGHRTFVF